MDLNDFKGSEKYKLIVPSVYIFSWVLLFGGNMYYPEQYDIYCRFGWVVWILKMLYLNYNMILILRRTFHTFRNQNILPPETPTPTQNLIHCFIIPSYNEPSEILAQTLHWIAKHEKAKTNYLVMLAMEEHEKGSDKKAQTIIQEFKDKFMAMDYTVHSMRPHEQKGKASNVSWCGEHLEEKFTIYGINKNNVLLTIIDVDSWVPPLYITKVEEYLNQNIQNLNLAIFVPPQIFTRNYMKVPMMVRVFDHTHSLAQLSNMRSNYNLIFPMSNYSLSYNLIKRIGYWDTCADAIGEDFHTVQKAFWKTRGEAFNVPIYVPFNQLNVETGKGGRSDVLARFWQAERHAQGVADVGYNINMLQKTQFFSTKSLLIVYCIGECFILPALLPWIALSTMKNTDILFFMKDQPVSVLTYLSIIGNIIAFWFYMMFEIFKRYTNQRLYGEKNPNESKWRILEYPLVITFDIILIGIPSFVVAAFRVLIKDRTYRVAEKNIKS